MVTMTFVTGRKHGQVCKQLVTITITLVFVNSAVSSAGTVYDLDIKPPTDEPFPCRSAVSGGTNTLEV